jgi:hypothetical protein
MNYWLIIESFDAVQSEQLALPLNYKLITTTCRNPEDCGVEARTGHFGTVYEETTCTSSQVTQDAKTLTIQLVLLQHLYLVWMNNCWANRRRAALFRGVSRFVYDSCRYGRTTGNLQGIRVWSWLCAESDRRIRKGFVFRKRNWLNDHDPWQRMIIIKWNDCQVRGVCICYAFGISEIVVGTHKASLNWHVSIWCWSSAFSCFVFRDTWLL